MFVSVKERARQIASGQFTASPTSAPVASLIDLAPEPKAATVATPKKTGSRETPAKAAASPSKTKLSKPAPPKDPTSKASPFQAPPSNAIPPATVSKTASTKTVPPPETSTPKKSSSKSKLTKEPASKPSSPKIGSSKSTSSSKATSHPKPPSSPKPASPTKAVPPTKPPSSKTPSTPSKTKRSKSPPKRVDSPISDDTDDPLSHLKAACLKQVAGVTGLGGRRLAIALKQRSSGEWYAALKDTGSDKYLKMWMNRDKTFATKEEALEAYLVFVTKMRNEVRWFPMSPRASSPKGKGK